MTSPVRVTLRSMARAPVLEPQIRTRAAWLKSFYSGLVECRVLLKIPHRHRERDGPAPARIELSLPGEDVVRHYVAPGS